MAKKWDRMAKQWHRNGWPKGYDQDRPWSMTYLEDVDVTLLLDRRKREQRDPEWVGLRNYLYGYDCRILAECSDAKYGVMLIDASRDLAPRLCREFLWLTLRTRDPSKIIDEVGTPESRAMIERFCKPELAHSVWGNVVVENGKPVGLMVNGEFVAQPVRRHWTRLAA
ncbi:MAG: hypothetical protein AB7O59_21125 [Pirellulales bacterium]